MSNCLNLRTVITYVTRHLEEGGFRIRRALQQSNQSLKSFPFHAAFFLPSHDGTSRNALPSYLPSLEITVFPRNLLTDVSSFLFVQNWVTWTPLNAREAWKVNIWPKIHRIIPMSS